MINPFSLITILWIGRIFFIKGKERRLIYLIPLTFFYESFLEVGYFLRFGNIEIGYAFFVNLFLFVYLLFSLIKETIPKQFFLAGMLLVGAGMLGNILLVFFPTQVRTANINISWDNKIVLPGLIFEKIHLTSFNLLNLFYLVTYIMLFIVIVSVFKKESPKLVVRSLKKMTDFILIIGIGELISKYLFRSDVFNTIVNTIFGISESTYVEVTARGSGFLLQGLTQESSHYVYVLFILFFVILANFILTKQRSDLYRLASLLLLLAVSMSFSSLIYFVAIIHIVLLWKFRNMRIEKKILWGVLQLAILLVLVFLVTQVLPELVKELSVTGFWGRRIRSVFEEISIVTSGRWRQSSHSLEWSNRVRLLSIYENAKVFLLRPIFGFGLGSVVSHSSTMMLLSGGGVVFALIWARFNFLLGRLKVTYEYLIVIVVFLAVNVFNSLSFRPFFDISAIIFSLSIVIIFGLKEGSYE
ncbi:hypothetical protein [Enterococcus xiangfangensis]|uniref:hypothetical protein n=1 Tax=Enterococcus xiangfangensis TaxID=1296537 RepID=UPI0010F8A488|nr:hypothetical protein [Enterococcus xiangfangensis]MBM7710853.1 hypothetical protein [Enterococcus xiangfangensis]